MIDSIVIVVFSILIYSQTRKEGYITLKAFWTISESYKDSPITLRKNHEIVRNLSTIHVKVLLLVVAYRIFIYLTNGC
jgi:hypothetical protein